MHGDRHVEWEGFFNTRDLGGLPTRDRGVTRFGAFIRSADLRFVTPSGWRAARAAGVRTIVDLRNDDEIRRPDTVTPSGIRRLEVPLDDIGDSEFWRHINQEQLNGSPLYYRPFLRLKAHRCAAALLLALAEVEPEAIAEDYELSTQALGPLFAVLGQPDRGPLIESILKRRGTTLRAAILAVLEEFDAGTYLLDAGVSAADLDAIRTRILG
jgi:hypothetical protein